MKQARGDGEESGHDSVSLAAWLGGAWSLRFTEPPASGGAKGRRPRRQQRIVRGSMPEGGNGRSCVAAVAGPFGFDPVEIACRRRPSRPAGRAIVASSVRSPLADRQQEMPLSWTAGEAGGQCVEQVVLAGRRRRARAERVEQPIGSSELAWLRRVTRRRRSGCYSWRWRARGEGVLDQAGRCALQDAPPNAGIRRIRLSGGRIGANDELS